MLEKGVVLNGQPVGFHKKKNDVNLVFQVVGNLTGSCEPIKS